MLWVRDSTLHHPVPNLVEFVVTVEFERWSFSARHRASGGNRWNLVHSFCGDDDGLHHETMVQDMVGWVSEWIHIDKFGETCHRNVDQGHINGCGKLVFVCHELLFEYFIYTARESGVLSPNEAARAAIVIDDGLLSIGLDKNITFEQFPKISSKFHCNLNFPKFPWDFCRFFGGFDAHFVTWTAMICVPKKRTNRGWRVINISLMFTAPFCSSGWLEWVSYMGTEKTPNQSFLEHARDPYT